jgi:hypothetical protein
VAREAWQHRPVGLLIAARSRSLQQKEGAIIIAETTRGVRRDPPSRETDGVKPSAPQKHAWGAKIILATADGCGTTEIMWRSGKAKPVVRTWQAPFMAEGVDGLMRDKTRKPARSHCRRTR